MVLVIGLLMAACGGTGNDSNAQNSDDSVKQTQTADTSGKTGDKTLGGSSGREADYKPAQNDNYKLVTNERFGFRVAIPKSWKAVNRSDNQDGYFIETMAQDVDLRVYGEEIGDKPTGIGPPECDRESAFSFRKGEGTKCLKEKTTMYYQEQNGKRIILFIDAPADWKKSNKAKLLHIAKSLAFIKGDVPA